MSRVGSIRVGTSGWMYRHWRGPFYPPGLPVARWFAHYARAFDTVEINNTFYRLPEPEVFEAWRQQAPTGFLYAVKASRYLTHRKKLKDPEPALEAFVPRARWLGPCLGPILYQLPPRWHCDPERLARFLALLPADLHHVFEFRDPSWYTDQVHSLLADAGAGFCMHDLHGSLSPEWVTGPVVYVRFHGPTQMAYAGRYPLDYLRRWADRLDAYHHSGKQVFAYFNNDAEGYAVANARELKGLLGLEAPARSA